MCIRDRVTTTQCAFPEEFFAPTMVGLDVYKRQIPIGRGVAMEIRILRDSERIEALQLAREVFLGFEAPEYSEEGVREMCIRDRFGALCRVTPRQVTHSRRYHTEMSDFVLFTYILSTLY